MSRKHLGMKRPVKQFLKAYEELMEYVATFEILPPRGEYATQEAIKEWKECFNNALIQFNNIRNTQIELLKRNSEED